MKVYTNYQPESFPMWWHLSTDLRKGRKEMWGSWGKALQAEGTVSAQPTRQEQSIFPQQQTRLEWMQKTGRWRGPCGAGQTALVGLYQVFLLFWMKQRNPWKVQSRREIRSDRFHPGPLAAVLWVWSSRSAELTATVLVRDPGFLGPGSWEEGSYSRYILLMKETFLHGWACILPWACLSIFLLHSYIYTLIRPSTLTNTSIQCAQGDSKN